MRCLVDLVGKVTTRYKALLNSHQYSCSKVPLLFLKGPVIVTWTTPN